MDTVAQWLARASPLLLGGLALGGLLGLGLLWLAWPWIAGKWPRPTSLLWPHVLVGGTLLGLGALLLGGFVLLLNALWRTDTGHLDAALLRTGWFELHALDWLWPGLPTVLALLLLLVPAARFLSRRNFHLTVLAVLLSGVLGVALHGQPQSSDFAQARAVTPGREVDELLSERLSSRVLDPVFHHPNTRPEALTLAAFGLLLFVGYGWLDRVNMRRSLRPIHVGCVEDVDGKRRPDLEQLMRECLHRNTPHTPAPLPGGELVYWQDFVEVQNHKDNHWFSRALALVMRLLHPPTALEIRGTVQQLDAEPWGRTGHAVRVLMTDRYSGQTLMARTFWDEERLEHAVEQAAYCAAERAMEECGQLPEWVYWREGDGSALRHYHNGIAELRHGTRDRARTERARALLREAAVLNPGSGALARLQLAEVLEVYGDYVGAIELYLELLARYPRLLVAKYRLASACRSVSRWGPRLNQTHQAGQLETREMHPWERLMEALASDEAKRLCRHTVLSRLIEWRRRHGSDGPRGPRELWEFWRMKPAPFPREELALHGAEVFHWRHLPRLQDTMLTMASRCLRELGHAQSWWVLGWSLVNTAERRLFWKTVLWPPRRRRASVLSVQASLRCVELRQLLRLEEAGGGNSLGSCQRKAQVLWRVRRLEREATRAVRIRGNWLGGVHYQLACFWSLCIGGTDARGKAFPEDVRQGRRATTHLSRSLQDPEGPFALATWRWMLEYPDLEPLKPLRSFQAWGRIIRRDKNLADVLVS